MREELGYLAIKEEKGESLWQKHGTTFRRSRRSSRKGKYGRKVTMDEMKKLSGPERQELGDLCRLALGKV